MLASSLAPTQTAAASSHTITFTAHGEPYNFTLTTNSTWNGVITNYGETKFNFTLTGPSGQQGSANATVCKTSGYFPPGQAKPQNIKIYLNGTRVANDTIQVENIQPSQKVACLWVYWTYHYSTNLFSADLSLAVPLQAPVFNGLLPLLLTISTLLVSQFAVSKKRRQRPQ